MTVRRAETVTPRMRRITLSWEPEAHFDSSSIPDERVLIHFPLDPPHARSYTVRAVRAELNELDVDMVLHGHGGAATWAARAAAGDRVSLSTANGWFRPQPDVDTFVLIADHTGLPAAGRILESLPSTAVVHLLALVPERTEQQTFAVAATVHAEWFVDDIAFLDAVTDSTLPEGTGYVWCAVESTTARRIRGHFRRGLGLTSDHLHVMGYWRKDRERWEQRYAEAADRIDTAMGEAMLAGKDFESVRDAVDDAMDREGL